MQERMSKRARRRSSIVVIGITYYQIHIIIIVIMCHHVDIDHVPAISVSIHVHTGYMVRRQQTVIQVRHDIVVTEQLFISKALHGTENKK